MTDEISSSDLPVDREECAELLARLDRDFPPELPLHPVDALIALGLKIPPETEAELRAICDEMVDAAAASVVRGVIAENPHLFQTRNVIEPK